MIEWYYSIEHFLEVVPWKYTLLIPQYEENECLNYIEEVQAPSTDLNEMYKFKGLWIGKNRIWSIE